MSGEGRERAMVALLLRHYYLHLITCVLLHTCIGGGENGSGEAQLPLGILVLDVGQACS